MSDIRYPVSLVCVLPVCLSSTLPELQCPLSVSAASYLSCRRELSALQYCHRVTTSHRERSEFMPGYGQLSWKSIRNRPFKFISLSIILLDFLYVRPRQGSNYFPHLYDSALDDNKRNTEMTKLAGQSERQKQ
ncbi:hypothetical protein WUBG_02837 [Wuchereria bancrofti]|uniref:Uncharacterized protein n=1 Tax=Wuchereria bancrofti TaxID=6293 RepID=J9F9K9_WUCBA|nr:hypothetical protein WUBG_02837 [Wuchereria bancrofti]